MGTSLRPFLERREEPGKEVVLGGVSPHYATDGGRNPARDLMAIYRRDERWKMVWYRKEFTIETAGVPNEPLKTDFVPRAAGTIELYDVRVDPHEQDNLADDPRHAERVEQFRKEMQDWWRDTGGGELSPSPGAGSQTPG